jgi:hypothetical protein
MSSEEKIGVIDLALLRLETLSDRAQQFIDTNMMDYAIREILDPMKNLAFSRGFAQSFIDSMSIVKIGFMQVGFAINYDRKTATGIPLNKLLEFGWNEFDITSSYPNGPMLHWTGGKYGPGDHFAYAVHHPGFIGYHMFHSLENWGFIEIFAFKLIKATSEYLEATAFK